jgi:hypothetical protein
MTVLQQFGELSDDPVGVIAEEGDDLGDESRRAPVVLQHLQLLELLVHHALRRQNKRISLNPPPRRLDQQLAARQAGRGWRNGTHRSVHGRDVGVELLPERRGRHGGAEQEAEVA